MLQTGTRVGRYEIQRRVAHGGMATLYLAQDPVLGRFVAVKLFLGDLELPDARERFVREARSAAALNHPNIVTIYDYGEFASQPYIVMEFIEGETLAAIIRGKPPVRTSEMIRWMEELCSAVEYAHASGVIHRDLKPLNLIIDGYGRLKVLDFGIARMRGSLATRATAGIGTAGYMAPEQILGGNIDHRSDIFSIGVVCYELLSGVEPFGADAEPAITLRILNEEPRRLDEVAPNIEPELADIVWTALRKDANERYPDAESMREALAAVRRRVEVHESEGNTGRYSPPAVSATAQAPRPPTGPGVQDTGRNPVGHQSAEKRAEREALVKKRTAQIQDLLQMARTHLAGGELGSARRECEQVLTLDASHPEALGLLEAIALREESTAPTIMMRSATPTPRPSPTPVIVPAAPSPPPSDGVVPAPAPQFSAAPPATKPTPQPVPDPVAISRRNAMVVGGVLLAAIVAVTVWFWRSPPPEAQALAVVDAVPWATIKEIRRGTDAPVALPADAVTPFSLPLAPGTYRISLQGPPPACETRALTLEVLAGAPSAILVERFAAMTAEKYFEVSAGPDAPATDTSVADTPSAEKPARCP